MIKLAYEEGTRHLFLTPHGAYLEDEEALVSEKIDEIREWIDAENMDLNIYPGAEIYVDPEDDEDIDIILEKLE